MAKSRFSFHRLEQKPSVKVPGLECVCVLGAGVSRGKRQRTLEPGNAADGYEMVEESPWKEPEQTSDFSFVSVNFLICHGLCDRYLSRTM